MATTERDTNNKTALRASLKKEDESLAARLPAAELPLVSDPGPVPAGSGDLPAPPPLPVKRSPETKGRTSRKGVARKERNAAKGGAGAVTVNAGELPADKQAQTKKAKVSEKQAKSAGAKEVAEPSSVERATKKGAKPSSAVGRGAKTPPPEPSAAQESVKLKEVVEQFEKTAREKGDKLVRYSVELLKSEVAAIESLRAELAKAAGWAASKSDILRAGVRVFAGQKVDQMKEVLAALAALPKERKKG